MQGWYQSSETAHFLAISHTEINNERKVICHKGSRQIQINKLPEGNFRSISNIVRQVGRTIEEVGYLKGAQYCKGNDSK